MQSASLRPRRLVAKASSPRNGLNRPFMIGICQGQTELSFPAPPNGVVSSRFLTGRAPVRLLSGAYLYSVRLFGPEFLCLVQINGQA